MPMNGKPSSVVTLLLLALGLAAGFVGFWSSLAAGEQWVAAAAAALTAVFAIALTYVIAVRQNRDTAKLEDIVRQVHELLLGQKELNAQSEYGSDEESEGSSPGASGAGGLGSEHPGFADEAIALLRARGAKLDFENLVWKRKQRLESGRGSLGWFVESPEMANTERWFVRKANGITVRKAMPRNLLDGLEVQAPLDPREIRHDFQLKSHGLGAWYARTYSGDLWKVWQPNRSRTLGIKVEQVAEDEMEA